MIPGWLRLRTRRAQILAAVAAIAVLAAMALWLSLPDVRPLQASNPPTTAMIELRRRQAATGGKPWKLRWEWRPLSKISPFLQRAVVFAEDAQFWTHEGVDWDAMEKAAAHDWQKRSLERGASTITQQVAKNLYLSPSRNPVRKLREILIAERLDRELGKRRVLEIYLNIAEWGRGVFGAEAAARRWFGCSAAELRPAQAARLAVALPNPFTRAPGVASRGLARKAAHLVRMMARSGLLDATELAAAEAELGVARPAAGTTEPASGATTAPTAAGASDRAATAGASDRAATAGASDKAATEGAAATAGASETDKPPSAAEPTRPPRSERAGAATDREPDEPTGDEPAVDPEN